MDRFAFRYCIGSAAVNSVWKAFEMWDAKVERFVDGNMKTTDMLLGEKFGVFTHGALTGPFMLPLKLFKTLDVIDIYFKGHKLDDYGMKKNKKHVSDYFF